MTAAAADPDPIPDWLTAKLRRAALRRLLSESLPFGAVLVLLLAVNLVWWLGEAESPWIPIVWDAIFLTIAYFAGRDFFRAAREWRNPAGSEEIAYLRRFGPVAPTADRVLQELQNPGNVRFGREATFTTGWVVLDGGPRFALRRLEDLVWVYPKQTTTKLNYVIPIGRSYRAVVCAAGAPEAEAKCSKDQSLAFTAHAQKLCPWIVAGFSEDARVRWDGAREKFVATVLQRKTAR